MRPIWDSPERYARRVIMEEIEKNDYNLNISRYISTTGSEIRATKSRIAPRL